MARNGIATHEDIFPAPYLEQVAHFNLLRRGARPPAPTVGNVAGTVAAHVNHGRWLVECPTVTAVPRLEADGSPALDGAQQQIIDQRRCGHAVIASTVSPYYMCTVCGNEANGGKWLAVVFPANRAAIEAELTQRRGAPKRRIASQPWDVPERNWTPGESVADLRAERIARGG